MQSKNYTTIRIVPMHKYDKRALHNQSECVHHRMKRRCAQKTGLLLNTAALFMFVASFYFYSKLFGVCNKVCTNESARISTKESEEMCGLMQKRINCQQTNYDVDCLLH